MQKGYLNLHHFIHGSRHGEYHECAWSKDISLPRYMSRFRVGDNAINFFPMKDDILYDKELDDLLIIMQLPAFDETLICRISKGIKDSRGPTTQNHVCVVPRDDLVNGYITAREIFNELRRFDQENPTIEGEMPLFKVPISETKKDFTNIKRIISKASLESLVSRYMSSGKERMILFSEDMDSRARLELAFSLFDFIDISLSIVRLNLITGRPVKASMKKFNLIISSRNIKGPEVTDLRLIGLDLEEPIFPRVSGNDDIYEAINRLYKTCNQHVSKEIVTYSDHHEEADVMPNGETSGKEIPMVEEEPHKEAERQDGDFVPEILIRDQEPSKIDEILVGFKCGSDEPVRIVPGHLFVGGVSQKSGKTTTLEALLSRSDFHSIVFKTKPGESSFQNGNVLSPFISSKMDWFFIESLLESQLGESMKDVRITLITMTKGCENLESLADKFQSIVPESLSKSDSRQLLLLNAYFERLFSEIKNVNFSSKLELEKGINIMDISELSIELQSVIISSILNTILNKVNDTIIVIPEAWKFIPQSRRSPCKFAIEKISRQGAARRNFIWFDSQDMAGVDKSLLKNVTVWLLGRQTERNEIEHTLDQIPIGKSMKPKTEEIMKLEVGVFYVCDEKQVKKTYIMPSWMNEEEAKLIAVQKNH